MYFTCKDIDYIFDLFNNKISIYYKNRYTFKVKGLKLIDILSNCWIWIIVILISLFMIGLGSPFALTEASSNWGLQDKVTIGLACEFIGLFTSSFTYLRVREVRNPEYKKTHFFSILAKDFCLIDLHLGKY